MSNFHIINERDNVAVVLEKDNEIPFGHKIALVDIKKGSDVFKYGHVIGKATSDIKKGELVHTHNLASKLDEEPIYQYQPELINLKKLKGTFLGYKRENGRAGIRNDIVIIPTVGCVNNVCKEIEKKAQAFIEGSIDSIYALTHQFGCSQLGEDQENIAHLLASLALNPNSSYVLFVGLGCENNSLEGIKKILNNTANIAYFNCQEVEDEIEYGLNIIKEFASKAKKLQRVEVDLSELCIGLKCGGSDSLSGITANPTVGKVSDRIISFGGSAILTEVPEMFGAEQILMNKCISKEIYQKYVDLIVNFKNYYKNLGYPIYENPSPGNKKGGISTLEEKSLGCVTKAGSSPIVDVLKYGEMVEKDGLNVLDGPGNDLIAATSLAASGCQLILFTTGRGTPFTTIVPTIKISSNNDIASKKNNWIDFNAFDMDDKALFDLVINTANGKYKTKQEEHREIAFFKKGVTL